MQDQNKVSASSLPLLPSRFSSPFSLLFSNLCSRASALVSTEGLSLDFGLSLLVVVIMEEGGDWDLQAVVRGCCGGVSTEAGRDPFSSFPPSFLLKEDDGFGVVEGGEEHKDLLFCFPNLLGTETTSLQELEELCKPFFSKSQSPQTQPQQNQHQQVMVPMSSAGSPTAGSSGARQLPQPRQQRPLSSLPTTITTTRSKRRKNQQKKVVCHVPADGLSSDMWAWRKYGQKPIKGSPYPRGYYRCSSSKGCLARKQVERSRADPGVFVITYTAEHNHPIPTHRNSLAGSTRHKFPQPSSSTTNNANQQVNAPASSSSLSPTTPLTSTMDEELLAVVKKEGEGRGGEEDVDVEVDEEEEEDEEGMLLVSDMEMLGEDEVLFLGLDELPQPNSDNHFTTAFSSSTWMTNNNVTAAGGR